MIQCPPEVTQDLPPRIEIPAGAEITWNPAGGDVYRGHLGREALLESRLTDAAKACPKP